MSRVGNTGVVQLPSEFEGDPISGRREVQIFQGDESDLRVMADMMLAAGRRYRMQHEAGPRWRLAVSVADGNLQDTIPVDQWERVTEWREEPLLHNPSLLQAAGGVTTAANWFQEIKDALKSRKPVSGPQAKLQLYNLMARGVESYPVRSVVLRRRRTAPISWLAASAVNAVEVAYTTARLIELFNIPQSVAEKLPDAPGHIQAPEDTYWAWLERSDDSVMSPALGKAEEIKEFIFGLVPSVLYVIDAG